MEYRRSSRGDVVTLSTELENVRDNTEAILTVYKYDSDGAHDHIIEFSVTVNDGKVSIDWEYEYHEDTDEIPTEEEMKKYGRKYNPPEYFFTIKLRGFGFGKDQQSGLLKFKDWMSIVLVDEGGTPLADEEYILYLPDGTEQRGKLDTNGFAQIEDLPPGVVQVEYPEFDNVCSENEEEE
jgi:hypothetical protein